MIHQCFMASQTGAIVVETESVQGELGVEHGRLVHARWKELAGEEAFWAILAEPGLAARFVANQRSGPPNIQRPAELILMDASIQLERLELEARGPDLSAAPAAADSQRLFRRTTMVRLGPEAAPGTAAKCYVLDEGTHAVGRSPMCDIVVSDRTVSGHHATVEVRGSVVSVRDEASRNGTLVNQRPVLQPTVLEDGDTVTFGMLCLKFYRSQKGLPVLIEEQSLQPEISSTRSIPRR